MATYFLLLSLNQDGRNLMHEDPEVILHAAHSSDLPDVQCMGLYAVLGDYDFITVLEAPDNESAARFSLELGVKAGVEVQTVPAIPVSRLEQRIQWPPLGETDPKESEQSEPSGESPDELEA